MDPAQRGHPALEKDETSTVARAVPPRRLLLRVEDAATELAVSRSTLYQLISAGELATVVIGRARRVPFAEIERLVAERTRCGR